MMVLSLAELANMLSALAAAVAAVCAVVAIRETRKANERQRAADAVRRYLELAIQFPKLSTEGTTAADREAQQYAWFVSFTLVMAKEILHAYPNDARWRRLISDQLSYNHRELRRWRNEEANYFEAFGDDVRQLVDEVLAAPAKKKAA